MLCYQSIFSVILQNFSTISQSFWFVGFLATLSLGVADTRRRWDNEEMVQYLKQWNFTNWLSLWATDQIYARKKVDKYEIKAKNKQHINKPIMIHKYNTQGQKS